MHFFVYPCFWILVKKYIGSSLRRWAIKIRSTKFRYFYVIIISAILLETIAQLFLSPRKFGSIETVPNVIFSFLYY